MVRPSRRGRMRALLTSEESTGVADGDNKDWDEGGIFDPVTGALDQWKQPVRVASTATVTISTGLNAGDTIDGVTLAAGDRVLLKDQSTASQNGIYVAGVTPARAADMDDDAEVLGALVYVIAGTANTATAWKVTNTSAVTVGSTSIVWAAFGTGGGSSTITTKDEGSTLSSTVTTLDFVGAGVTATGGGATTTVTIPGSSLTVEEVDGSPTDAAVTKIVFPSGTLGIASHVATYTPTATTPTPEFGLDNISLNGTYGDHYAATSLDAKWTRRLRADKSETFDNSWMLAFPYTAGAHYGDLQSFTDTAEFEVQMAASFSNNGGDEGFGIAVLNSLGTGIWLGFRASSRLGIFTVTTYTTASEPSSNIGYAGSTYVGFGRKVWYSIIKKKCRSVDIYWCRFSFDGERWGVWLPAGYAPTSFTPSQIGWYVGVQNATTTRSVAIDWFNVVDNLSIGNNLMVTPSSGTVTATASVTAGGSAASVIDNNGTSTDWFFAGSNTAPQYWLATFSVAQTMNRLRFMSRTDAWGTGYVEFSDGSTYPIYLTGGNGIWGYLDFPTKTTTTVKVWWTKQANGTNPGFDEIEAYLAS